VIRMRKTILAFASMALAMLLASGVVLAQQTTPPVPEQTPAVGEPIPGRYIVVLEEADEREGHDPAAVALDHARHHGAEVLHTYQHAVRGYAARIPDRRLEEVRADSSVAHVEPDRTVHAEAQRLPWGIDRVDADASSTRAGNGSGAVSNVHAYVVDSGIDRRHRDLRVVNHVNFTGDGKNRDCHGHGTHVAGTIAAKDNARDVVGVAPGAPLIGVKVLGCKGGGALSGVSKGIDWVTAHANKPAIANMSLGNGGEPSPALDEALRKSARRGILYSVPAGNKGTGTCSGSPARTGAGTNNGIVTTAMTNEEDEEAPLSNYGPCVDLWAPGVLILSTKLGGGTTRMGGTSMAAPHVAGGAALYLSSHPSAGSSAVERALKDAAVKPGTKSKGGRAVLLENVGGF
jgi:subtilisin family serine protease